MGMSKSSELINRINELKKQKNAVILAHYYTSEDVQAVADFLGDSLALSIKAQEIDAPVILFAGVNFMAETAKVLCPEKKVLIPVPEAGCSLAESCQPEEFAAFKAKYPDHTVVSYVNTSVGIKALTDICCTSTNALQVVQSIPADRPIIFGPDRNLGAYIKKLTGRENMVIWNGACTVHEEFSYERLMKLKAQYPAAKVVAHPECPARLLTEADYIGSTAGILTWCGKDQAQEFIVVTEPGILTEMKKRYPQKTFIPAPADQSDCNECRYMKMVNLENILSCLENEAPEVILDEPTRRQAEKAIRNMISIF
ncbi:MAG: quinolinate synthase NadA [Bacteroidales bacterium]|nr:quinolinate synthase NadA [Bacteroidales bacterium]